jgi:hypothetical protein
VQAVRGSVESLGGDGAEPRRSIASRTPAWASARPGLEPDPEHSARGCFRKSRLLLGTTSRVLFCHIPVQAGRGDPEGHRNSDSTREQVFLRVRSTCCASAATMGDGAVPRPNTCFLNIVRRHRPPCLTSGSQQGSISGFGPADRGPEGNPWSGPRSEQVHPSGSSYASIDM